MLYLNFYCRILLCSEALSCTVPPLKTRLVTSRPSAPWYSEEIAAEKRKRRKLERHWRKSGTVADKLQYADQCGRVRKLLKSSKMSNAVITLRLLMKINRIPKFYLTP